VTGGDLRPTAPAGKCLEPVGQWQFRLRGVPTARELSGDRPPTADFHSETVEAQRAWTVDGWVVIGIAKTVARLAGLTRSADGGRMGRVRRLGRAAQ
jgi:hypothetical protein